MTGGTVSRAAIAAAYIAACRLEVRTLKPGNVHIYAAGHRMTVADFDTSADVSAPFISNPALGVGERILKAVQATFAAVSTNTNLGILLLCAPLAAAAERRKANASFTESLRATLDALDHEDARAVYRAIAVANPAGLGEDKSGDVRAAPPATWTLLDAMRAAAARDMIAAQYASGFTGVLAGARSFAADVATGAAPEDALAILYLRSLASHADTHIVRKHGHELAERVRARAADFLSARNLQNAASVSSPESRNQLLALDAELKSWGANPGSTADLMCASAFTAAMLEKDAGERTR